MTAPKRTQSHHRKIMYPFQVEDTDVFHKQLDDRGIAVSHHEQGLGKSLMALTLADERNYRRVCVLGPSVARLAWVDETDKWMIIPREVIIINGSRDIKKLAKAGPDVLVVCTYDLCRNDDVSAALRDFGFDFHVLDEFQQLRTPTAGRTRAVFATDWAGTLSKFKNIMIMSGTPVVGWPIDLWCVLKRFAPTRILNEHGVPMPYEEFRDEYHLWYMAPNPSGHKYAPRIPKITNTKNLSDLHERLQGWAIRRRKNDVLKDLPPMITREWPLEVTTADRKAFMDSLEGTLEPYLVQVIRQAVTPEEMAAAAQRVMESSIHTGTLVRLCGEAKVAPMIRALKKELYDSTYKIGIMSWNHSVIDAIYAGLADYNPVGISGITSAVQDRRAKEAFMEDPECRVFNGQISACSTALTLTSASRIIFPQLSWTPGDNKQAAARFHRIGQRDSVDCRIPTIPNSIDSAFNIVLSKKTLGADEVIER